MKIIGKTDTGFIVAISENEIANICGHSYSNTMKAAEQPAIGREVKVSELYRALVVSRERKEEISKLANQLRVAAGRVDTINQALASPIVEVEVKA